MATKLTILVGLKGREQFTERLLSHCAAINLPYKILLADGSRIPFYTGSHTFDLPPNIKYFYAGEDISVSRYLSKISMAMEMVDTPYVMGIDNDDFLGAGIPHCIDFLDSHSGYVCAGGRTVGFSVVGNLPYGRLNRLYEYYHGGSIYDPSPADRVVKGSNKLWIYYAVHRTEAYRAICQEVCQLDLSDLMLREFYHVARALSMGRAYFDNKAITYFRQYGTSSSAPEQSWTNQLFTHDISNDARKIVNRIATEIGQSYPEIDAISDKIYTALIEKYEQFLNASYGHPVRAAIKLQFPKLVQWLMHSPRPFINERIVPLKELAAIEQILENSSSCRIKYHGQANWSTEQGQTVS